MSVCGLVPGLDGPPVAAPGPLVKRTAAPAGRDAEPPQPTQPWLPPSPPSRPPSSGHTQRESKAERESLVLRLAFTSTSLLREAAAVCDCWWGRRGEVKAVAASAATAVNPSAGAGAARRGPGSSALRRREEMRAGESRRHLQRS